MATLKELFVKIGFDGRQAIDGIKQTDKAVDSLTDSVQELDKEIAKTQSGFKSLGDSLKNEGPRLKEWGSSVASAMKLAAASIAGVAVATGKLTLDFAHNAREIEQTAKQYGLSAQSLQEWQYAAKAAGGQAEAVQEVFKELAIRITEVAETGTGPATDALTYLKIKAEDLKRLKPEQQMELLADKISQVADEGTRFFLKDSLFGEEGSIKIGTLLENGAQGIRKFREEARSLGGILGGDALNKAREFNLGMLRVEETIKGVRNTVAVSLLPVVERIANAFADWARRNKDVIATRIEGFVVALADAMAKLAPLAANTLEFFVKLSDSIGGADKALIAMAGAWATWKVAALAAIGPVGAAVAALGVGIAAGAALVGQTQKYAKDLRNLRADETEAFNKAARVLNTPSSGAPGEDEARRILEGNLLNFAETARLDQGKLRSAETDAALREGLKEVVESAQFLREVQHYARDNGPAPSTGDESTPGKVKRPGSGGKAPATLGSLTRAEEARLAEMDRLRGIRIQAESARANAGGRERSVLDAVISGIDKQLGGAAPMDIHELIASAVGQGTGLGGGALKPAGLGTTINHIDASITVNVGGIDVEIPTAAIRAGDPAGSGQAFGNGMLDQIRAVIDDAARLQRAQIYG